MLTGGNELLFSSAFGSSCHDVVVVSKLQDRLLATIARPPIAGVRLVGCHAAL